MGVALEFVWSVLSLLFVAIAGFYCGRWAIFNVGQRKKKSKNKKSSVVGDSLAQPMEVYGSVVAPSRSAVAEVNIGNTTASSLPYDPGASPVEEHEKP